MNLIEKFKLITTFILDVDGVLTDGSVYVFENGEQVRRMSIKDGYALQLAVKKGYRILVISGSNSPAVVTRLKKLGIEDVHMNVLDKQGMVLQYIKNNALKKEHVLFMGDDVPDYIAMKEAGLAVAPANAAQEIKKAAVYITSAKGGEGCVREVIEKVLRLNGHWGLETDIPSR
jgi:3-deoxy-D-manno-octulosonate 8-phosphate phosphatase (KDO 8-P phosphatase)